MSEVKPRKITVRINSDEELTICVTEFGTHTTKDGIPAIAFFGVIDQEDSKLFSRSHNPYANYLGDKWSVIRYEELENDNEGQISVRIALIPMKLVSKW